MDANHDDAPSRYELNRHVSRVLVRHEVDLEAISVSCSGYLVYLSGFLKRLTKKDPTAADIDAMFREIERIPGVRGIVCDLENWVVTNADGAWLVTPKGPARSRSAASEADAAYRMEDRGEPGAASDKTGRKR